MTDEPKDQRIPIMMSASEVEAIDDWSFKHRIRARSEAIRRLCSIALSIDARSEELTDDVGNMPNMILTLFTALNEERDEKKERNVISILSTMYESAIRSFSNVRHTLDQFESAGSGEKFKDFLDEMERKKEFYELMLSMSRPSSIFNDPPKREE